MATELEWVCWSPKWLLVASRLLLAECRGVPEAQHTPPPQRRVKKIAPIIPDVLANTSFVPRRPTRLHATVLLPSVAAPENASFFFLTAPDELAHALHS